MLRSHLVKKRSESFKIMMLLQLMENEGIELLCN